MQDRVYKAKERACVVTRSHCCVDCCVVNKLGYDLGKQVIFDTMMARDSMTRQENKNDLRGVIKILRHFLYI